MKKLVFLPLVLTSCLFANSEYPYIQPVSVEKGIQETPQVIQEVKQLKKTEEVQQKQEEKVEQSVQKELDSDNDGVVDSQDKCPNTPQGFNVDMNGCPTTKLLHVTFQPNSYDVTEKVLADVKEFADFLQKNDMYDVIIYGYTDSSGDAENNKALSQKRADAVKEALSRYGISKSRLTSIGKGEVNPIADNSTAEGRAQNRRIEVELIQ